VAGAFRRPELAQSFRLDLADPLTRYVELLADLFERVLAFAADAEAQADDFLLLGRKRLQNIRGFVADVGVDHGINGRSNPAVFNQVPERGFTVAADRSFERHRVAGHGLELLDLLHRNVHAAMRMVRDWSAMARVIAWRIHQVA
jgi:hypothetical protein